MNNLFFNSILFGLIGIIMYTLHHIGKVQHDNNLRVNYHKDAMELPWTLYDTMIIEYRGSVVEITVGFNEKANSPRLIVATILSIIDIQTNIDMARNCLIPDHRLLEILELHQWWLQGIENPTKHQKRVIDAVALLQTNTRKIQDGQQLL